MMVKLSSVLVSLFVITSLCCMNSCLRKGKWVTHPFLPLFLKFVAWSILLSLVLFLSLTLPWTRTSLIKVLNLLFDLCFLISIYLWICFIHRVPFNLYAFYVIFICLIFRRLNSQDLSSRRRVCGCSGIWFFPPCTSLFMLLMDLMKHVTLMGLIGWCELLI